MDEQGRITYHINNLQEGLDVEVKNWLDIVNDNTSKARLAKEIIALGNHGGGYIFIGFDEEDEKHPEIEPEAGQREMFTQDNVAALVNRYVSPPCQCRIEFISPEDSQILHPVVIVPGEHRTPLYASRNSPENTLLQQNKIYVRRPGGYSEEARNQDDWEKIIERLVKARQGEQLNAIREILNPSSRVVQNENKSLEEWRDSNYEAWEAIVDEFDDEDPRKLESGHWMVSFSISPFETASLTELNQFMDREAPTYSGWPPFTYIHRAPINPTAEGDAITAYMGHLSEGETAEMRYDHSDYWKINRDGYGFLLRPMQEDRPGYARNSYPEPVGPFFDWTLPIYRMSEVLKLIEALGSKFGNESEFEILVTYKETSGRKLEQHSGSRYMLHTGAECAVNTIESKISGSISEIEVNIEELITSLLVPVYEQFQFTALPPQLVTNVVREVLNYPR